MNDVYWDSIEATIRRLLADAGFRSWEVEAISTEATNAAREPGGLTVDRLAEKLHSRSFDKGTAQVIAQVIVGAYKP